MLDKYRGTGRKKAYLIFGMCDESFSINCTADIPDDVDKGWFMFFVTLINHVYWVCGATIGGFLGSLVEFNTKGLDFVMTALFVVIFVEQWMKEKTHHSAILGLVISLLCLIIFGGENFIIPAMLLILTSLTAPLENNWRKRGKGNDDDSDTANHHNLHGGTGYRRYAVYSFSCIPIQQTYTGIIQYLGKVLPSAALGLLVIYCFKNVSIFSGTHALPELISVAVVIFLHVWKRQMLISIAGGTVVYMLLVQFVF